MQKLEFSQALLHYRAENNMTQQELADILQVSSRTIILWEQGGILPRKTMRMRAAKLLGVPADTFFDSKPEEGNTDSDASVERVLEQVKQTLIEAKYPEQTLFDCEQVLRKVLEGGENKK